MHSFGRSPSRSSYDPLSSSQRPNSSLRNRQNADQHPPQHPQQYAQPLQRQYSSEAQHGESAESRGGSTPKPAENMLRRKTPNGVLASAYDGSQGEKPHTSKHILLPVSENAKENGTVLSQNASLELPVRPSSGNLSTNNISNRPESWPQNEVWDPGVQGGPSKRPRMMTQQPNLPQIDSMLQQMPQQTPWLNPNGQVFNGFVQQTLQAPPGPTASNSHGPFGPYWPDGTFVAYRPAAMRDPRYFSNVNMAGMSAENNGWQGRPAHFPSHNGPYASQRGHSFSMPSNPFQGQPQVGHPGGYGPQHHNYPSPFSPDLYGFRRNSSGHFNESSGQSTPRGSFGPATTPMPDFGPQSPNIMSRERVFAFAHASYVELLKYINSTKKGGSYYHYDQGYHRYSRPSIFPKPPPQLNMDTLGSGSARTPTDSESRQSVFSTAQSHRPSGFFNPQQLHTRHENASPYQTPTPWPQPQGPNDHQEASQWPSWHAHGGIGSPMPPTHPPGGYHTLRRSTTTISPFPDQSPSSQATIALHHLTELCNESNWTWVDGILLGACLAYALSDYTKSMKWNSKILEIDANHVEALSNLAATLLAIHRKKDAEKCWLRAIKLRPSYFEAVEHLVGLFCSDHRGNEAVEIIEHVERALQCSVKREARSLDRQSESSTSTNRSPCVSELSDRPLFDYDVEGDSTYRDFLDGAAKQPGFGSSGYAIPASENGRMLQLVHAKGNMLYAMGETARAAKAFEGAVLIGAGRHMKGVDGLIQHILKVVSTENMEPSVVSSAPVSNYPILLPPEKALITHRLCFPSHGELPGLVDVPSDGMAKKAAVSTTSNSLLSLAKIFQDGMATSSPKATAFHSKQGVREILALYYLSLSLQPSPSTANNVGILLASVQQAAVLKVPFDKNSMPRLPGVTPGSGVALALAYYNYGLNLDLRHAHLYTNLGSLLKDIGQLNSAIQMYEKAVQCDPNFDIALANLANAVKDRGQISDAIFYYKRAVTASPDFAEAVCGLANALNSVCSWQSRGGIATHGGKLDRWHVDDNGLLLDATKPGASSSGWIKRVVDLVEKQLRDGEAWGQGNIGETFMEQITHILPILDGDAKQVAEKDKSIRSTLATWSNEKWEGARLVRLVERIIRRLQWQWYQDAYVRKKQRSVSAYSRPQLPPTMTVPSAPTVLPFHTFTCPMTAEQIRYISQRNGLRISCSTLKSNWLPWTVYKPPPPPSPFLRVGYVSSDFNNHPLAHLMQSVFGMHDSNKVKAYCYATTPSDNSVHRQQIERESPVFYEASNWTTEKLVNQIHEDGIHILVNLNGYTRGARNEVFAARPAPIQMSFMGFAGTLGAEWCDYLVADDTAISKDTLRPYRNNVTLEDQLKDENSGGKNRDWIYGENIVFCKDTFFCCDHRQSAPDAKGEQLSWEKEQERRWAMRKELFPSLSEDVVIFGNFNQLYKIEPTTFRTWLRILQRVPNAILWLLRFPDVGESYLRATATAWAGPDVASRIMFTDVAPKAQHISRARVCDLFLDTPECNAHTTAADVLWSGTPLLTLPRYEYKMCSRMAASILKGALPKTEEGVRAGKELIVKDEVEYEERAVRFGSELRYRDGKPVGRLGELRKLLYEARWNSALFDTRRWVRDLEEAYETAWRRWCRGEGGDIWLKGSHGRESREKGKGRE
ncbi:glycosyltransferase family 41 protein [Aulographum hederae CBS 113979]|uniref:protein O-GlcNAc transferase n=1 Tax=Aulographum hederae CBS 113979 TaxID=1176131 RepID=A0A6G1HHF0_9PEZI|nr:glycosyltransferase family 41 protein [Aulographum hederae CBS 113979]